MTYTVRFIDETEIEGWFKARKWQELFEALSKLDVDEGMVIENLTDTKEVERARSAVHRMDKDRKFTTQVHGLAVYVKRIS